MDTAEIADEIASLPAEAQRQVADFVAFLRSRYAAPGVRRTKRLPSPEQAWGGVRSRRKAASDSDVLDAIAAAHPDLFEPEASDQEIQACPDVTEEELCQVAESTSGGRALTDYILEERRNGP